MSGDLLETPSAPLRMTAGEVRAALKRYYAQPHYGIVFEVAQATGYRANRHLDAIAMSLWPSRGLHLYGIEIKVNYYDWKRELGTPEKAEELARFCDYFLIAAPRGVIPFSEIPANWGLIEIREDGVVEAKAPAKLKPVPLGHEFLAAVFRAASREVDPETLDAMVAKRERELQSKFDERVKDAVEHRRRDYARAGEHWHKLCEAVGENADKYFFSDHDIIEAVKIVKRAGLARSYGGIKDLHNALTACLSEIGPVLAELGIETEKTKLPKKRRAA